MVEFVCVYSIVPISDGLRCVCKDGDGNHFTAFKNSDTINQRLLFDDEIVAQKYIDRYLSNGTYRPERLSYNAKYLPKNIIRDV